MTTYSMKDAMPLEAAIINSLGSDPELLAELKAFEAEKRAELGLHEGPKQWEDLNPSTFTTKQRAHTTMWISGLTMAQDYLIKGALLGLGYKVEHLDCPDNEALRYGKEFGNRGQCNPTYYTVGNLVKTLVYLRDVKGIPTEDLIKNYLFLTAGACGPCRFGTYVTEYRKALRDAGFDGFRVLLFQQTGGFKQATGDENGLKMDPAFFIALVKALVTGDIINAMGYRIRPYEVIPGSTNAALEDCKQLAYETLANKGNMIATLFRIRKRLNSVAVNRLQAKPKACIIGEFWAMTTEGDGNYRLQSFLEEEGAEVDIQLVTAWMLYMLWEGRRDTMRRMDLREADTARRSLKVDDPLNHIRTLWAAEKALRGIFQTYANIAGLHDYHLPDMDEVAAISHKYYDNELRGGEGHMEVGKLIQNVVYAKSHMVVSVKPFGCMPSSGVSDGVQSIITERYPDAIFLPIETSGDGKVNVQSRVQMMLFKAKQKAKAEFERTVAESGFTLEQIQAYIEANPKYGAAVHKAPHTVAGSGADLVIEVAAAMRSRPTLRSRAGRMVPGFLKRVASAAA